MVNLTLIPHRGNSTRAYPFTGILGLTPITILGTLKSFLDEDLKTLDASSIQIRVRCYEGVSKNKPGRVLYEHVRNVWEAGRGVIDEESVERGREGEEIKYEPIGEFKCQWKIVLPKDIKKEGGVGTINFKHWKVWWSLDGVINHRPTQLYGSRVRKAYPLLLVNHGIPKVLPFPPLWKSHPNSPIDYTIESTSDLLTSSDPFTVNIKFKHLQSEPLPFKRFILELHREILRSEPLRLHSPDRHPLRTRTSSLSTHPSLDSNSSGQEDSQDESPILPRSEFISPSPTSSVTSINSQLSFTQENLLGLHLLENNTELLPVPVPTPGTKWSKESTSLLSIPFDVPNDSSTPSELEATFKGVTPLSRTIYHYSLGETVAHEHFHMRFYFTVKLVTNEKEIFTLPPREIVLSAVSQAERKHAKGKFGKIRVIQAAETKLFCTTPTPTSVATLPVLSHPETVETLVDPLSDVPIRIGQRKSSLESPELSNLATFAKLVRPANPRRSSDHSPNPYTFVPRPRFASTVLLSRTTNDNPFLHLTDGNELSNFSLNPTLETPPTKFSFRSPFSSAPLGVPIVTSSGSTPSTSSESRRTSLSLLTASLRNGNKKLSISHDSNEVPLVDQNLPQRNSSTGMKWFK